MTTETWQQFPRVRHEWTLAARLWEYEQSDYLDIMVISFNDGLDDPSLITEAEQVTRFGHKRFHKYNIPHACVGSMRNDRYQNDNMEDLIERLLPHIHKYKKIVTYWGSMGGFAALAFGQALQATDTLVFTPQIKIDLRPRRFSRGWPFEIIREIPTNLDHNIKIYRWENEDDIPQREWLSTNNNLNRSWLEQFVLPLPNHNIMGTLQVSGELERINFETIRPTT